MISISGALTVENAGTYYRQHYSSVGEYYAPTADPTIGYALGKGAETLGLAGDITAEQFQSLLRGIDPNSQAMLRGTVLRPDAVQRAGFDMTFSPPKSISIQALVAGDARLIEADRRAALRAIREAERCALSKQHGGSQTVQTENVCAVMFEHYDARESITGRHGPMPQLHHHTFINNLTQRPDGQWRALDGEQIYRARPFIDAVYMTELARIVQELGYGIVRGPDLSFELKGFTRQQIEAFSERSQDIERVKAERGITNAKAARAIRLETRKAKREHDPETLKAEREKLAAEHGIDLSYRPTIPVRIFNVDPDAQAQRSLEFAVRDVTNRHAVADHRDIMLAALRHGLGSTDLDHVQAQIDRQRDNRQLIAAGNSRFHPLNRYTTPEMVRLERENLALVREGMNRGKPVAGIAVRSAVDGKLSGTGTGEVREWAVKRKLLLDQTDAAVLTLTSGHWATAVEGLAGSAKTSLNGALKDFAEQHRWTVRGFGTTSGSVEALEKAGVKADTIAGLLAKPLPSKTTREFWIVDESSLLATMPINELLKIARQRGVERIVFVGDQRQHLAVAAGSPMRQLLADNMAVAELTTIRRQKEPGLLKAVEMAAAGRTEESIDLLIEQKRIVEIKDPAARYERIAAEYLNAHEARQNCLVVSPANEERKDINQAVRAKLVEAGHVQSLGQKHQILIPRDMTDPQKQNARSYHEGEVIYFRRGSKAQQIPKRAYLTVAAVNSEQLSLEKVAKDETLTLRAENGRLIQFDPSRWKGINVYTTEERTIAVGDRLEWRERDNQRRIANHHYGTITKLDARQIAVQFDNGRKLTMPLSEARKVDLGYCSTSHASQGSTFDRAIVHIDSGRRAELVNVRQFYVGSSRPEWDLRIYTDSVQGMRRAVARTQEKELALDVVQKQPSLRHSTGMRM